MEVWGPCSTFWPNDVLISILVLNKESFRLVLLLCRRLYMEAKVGAEFSVRDQSGTRLFVDVLIPAHTKG